MNRRSVLRWLGLAPVAAPAAVAAAALSSPSSADLSGLTANIGHLRTRLTQSEASIASLSAETVARANADAAQLHRLITADLRLSALEGRVGMLATTAVS